MLEAIKNILLDPNYGMSSPIGIALSTTMGMSFTLWRKWRKAKLQEILMSRQRPRRLVLITGCDSGLGFSMACWAAQMGYNVIAGCLNADSDGAKILQREFGSGGESTWEKNDDGNDIKGVKGQGQGVLKVVRLDVTDQQSIDDFREQAEQFMQARHTKLWAVISNAAVMVCGEFMWQTKAQMHQQMNVNFWGTANLTATLKPLLFHDKSRLIVISSDCSKLAWPCLAPYAASKTALESWSRALRLEVAKYGIHVVSYHPGSFPFESQIMSNQGSYFKDMEEEMNPHDRDFFGEYFKSFRNLKIQQSQKAKSTEIKPLESKKLQKDLKFLLEGDIQHTPVVKRENFFYKLIFAVEAFCPRWMSDKMLRHFVDIGTVKWTPPLGGYPLALMKYVPK